MNTSFGFSLQTKYLKPMLQEVELKEFCPKYNQHLQIIFERLLGYKEHIQPMISKLSEKMPLTYHSVGYNLGLITKKNATHIKSLEKTLNVFPHPNWISAHLCLIGSEDNNYLNLLPLHRNHESLKIVCENIRFLQNSFGIPVAIENVTEYASLKGQQWSLERFLCEILEKTDCKLLLDLNNLYITHRNQGESHQKSFDESIRFISKLPQNSIHEVHLAGHGKLKKPEHKQHENLFIDTHASRTSDTVISLLKYTLSLNPDIFVTLEREAHIPEYSEIIQELEEIYETCTL